MRNLRLPCALLAATLVWPTIAAAGGATWPDLSEPPGGCGGGEADAAVIIGIADYTAMSDIPGATGNANDWVTWLVRGRGVPLAHVEVRTTGTRSTTRS